MSAVSSPVTGVGAGFPLEHHVGEHRRVCTSVKSYLLVESYFIFQCYFNESSSSLPIQISLKLLCYICGN